MKGFDYAGGRPSGLAIKQAGGGFVCRYLTDGGSGLPGKQLQGWEVGDMHANGVQIVANFETTADRALDGWQAGHDDAVYSDNYTRGVGLAGTPIYFSVDFDVSPGQQNAINAYFQGAAAAIGVGRVGGYSGYWTIKRLFDAGLITYGWQTSAWSGGNLDPRAHIFQDANAGYAWISGVQCDIDQSLKDDFGQFNPNGEDMPLNQQDKDWIVGAIYTCLETYVGPIGSDVKDLRFQDVGSRDLVYVNNDPKQGIDLEKSFPGLPIFGNRTRDDVIAAMAQRLGVPGAFDPKPNGDGKVVAPTTPAGA